MQRREIAQMRENGMKIMARHLNRTLFTGQQKITHQQMFKLIKNRFYLGLKMENVDLDRIAEEIQRLSVQDPLKLKKAAIRINQELGFTLLGTKVEAGGSQDPGTMDLIKLITALTSKEGRTAMLVEYQRALLLQKLGEEAQPAVAGPAAAEAAAVVEISKIPKDSLRWRVTDSLAGLGLAGVGAGVWLGLGLAWLGWPLLIAGALVLIGAFLGRGQPTTVHDWQTPWAYVLTVGTAGVGFLAVGFAVGLTIAGWPLILLGGLLLMGAVGRYYAYVHPEAAADQPQAGESNAITEVIPRTILKLNEDLVEVLKFLQTKLGRKAFTEMALMNRAINRNAEPDRVARNLMLQIAETLHGQLPARQRYAQWFWKKPPWGA